MGSEFDFRRCAVVPCFRPEGGDCVCMVIGHVVVSPPFFEECSLEYRGASPCRGDLVALRIDAERLGRADHAVRMLAVYRRRVSRGR